MCTPGRGVGVHSRRWKVFDFERGRTTQSSRSAKSIQKERSRFGAGNKVNGGHFLTKFEMNLSLFIQHKIFSSTVGGVILTCTLTLTPLKKMSKNEVVLTLYDEFKRQNDQAMIVKITLDLIIKKFEYYFPNLTVKCRKSANFCSRYHSNFKSKNGTFPCMLAFLKKYTFAYFLKCYL